MCGIGNNGLKGVGRNQSRAGDKYQVIFLVLENTRK